jgi:hypothetical protein
MGRLLIFSILAATLNIQNPSIIPAYSMALFISMSLTHHAYETKDYKQLCVTVTLCITTNVSKLPPHKILNRKTGQQAKKKMFAQV